MKAPVNSLSKAIASVFALSLSLTACVDDSGGNSTKVNADNFDFVRMLANYADNIIIPNYQDAAQQSAQLGDANGAIAEYCSAIDTAQESAALTNAQLQWQETMDAWQLTELHQLGPATDNNSALRNRVLSFSRGNPLSSCGVDQATVLASTDSSFDLASRPTNQRGLGAVEYLLFEDDLNHTCPSQIQETADWNQRPEVERKTLRCNYALLLAEDVSDAASSIAEAWATSSGNYRSTFVNPANAGSNTKALSDALFYLDTETKDAKLGIPLGISANCSQPACPEVAESPYAEHSLRNVESNLNAFITLINGGSGLGFDDIINQAGVSTVTELLLDNTAAALAEIDAISASLSEQASGITSSADESACATAADNPDGARDIPACNVYGYIRRITDTLKVGFVAAVDVDLPDRAQSDND
ncbi:imelysin family protein [Spongiibacter marinus]|uniref:imelysin family protein n=1 Tax=Spongiibacter marinus TaxID=354246 RepID=UPI0035693D4E